MFGPFRGCGCLVLAIMGFLLGLVALVVGWPWAAAWYANGSLPRTWSGRDGSFTLAAVSATPLTGLDPQARLSVPAGRMRELVSQASGQWIPPWTMRGGFSAAGTWSMNDLGPGEHPWLAETSWFEPTPHLVIRLPVAEANRLIAVRLALQPGSPLKRATLTSLRVADADPADSPPLVRRFAIDAAGDVTIHYLGDQHTLVIRHLGAFVHLRLEPAVPAGRGFHPIATLDITDLDVPMLNLPIVGQLRFALIRMLEEAANASLTLRLAGVAVPGWYPVDLGIDAMTTP